MGILRPLLVLSANHVDPAEAHAALERFADTSAHIQTASMSTNGVQRTIADTGHTMQIDQPDAIVDAVRELVAKVVLLP